MSYVFLLLLEVVHLFLEHLADLLTDSCEYSLEVPFLKNEVDFVHVLAELGVYDKSISSLYLALKEFLFIKKHF